jgi:UDP-N-acetylmuramate dehydrogenase
MGFTYRHCGVAGDVIFTQALVEPTRGDPVAIAAEMDQITAARETTQPVKSRTGGSTFKNPPGQKAWALIDAAGFRAKLRQAGFYTTWKDKYGEGAWAILEKSVGALG